MPHTDLYELLPSLRLDIVLPHELTGDQEKATCTPEQNAINLTSRDYLKKLRSYQYKAMVHMVMMDDDANDLITAFNLQREADKFSHGFAWVDCFPSFSELNDVYGEYARAFNDTKRQLDRITFLVYGNADREWQKLRELAEAVARERRDFEADGRNGIPALEDAHELFWRQLQKAAAFRLETVYHYSGAVYDAAKYKQELESIQKKESQESTITELDRLRDEYRVYKRARIPLPSEFTQKSSSKYFTFKQLIGETPYSWAILTDRAMTAADDMAEKMIEKGWKAQVNSCYRNPARINPKAPESRHQYGDALDWQTFDFNGSGKVSEKDWKLLADFLQAWSPSYTESMKESGVGHVHVDFRHGE